MPALYVDFMTCILNFLFFCWRFYWLICFSIYLRASHFQTCYHCIIFGSFYWFLSVFFLRCRYKKLLSSVDLTKDFYYSYTYPIMQSLQKNVLSMAEEGMPYENIFVWNAYLTQPIRSRCKNTIWTIALVHGHFKQVFESL